MTPRAITGIGICSAIGIGRDEFFRALPLATNLRDSPRPPAESFDSSKYADAGVAEVRDFDPTKYLGDKGLRSLDRLTKLLVVAARLATHDAGFKKDGVFVEITAERVGIVCSNAYGSLEAITELDRVAVLEDARYINPAKFPNTVANSASGYASIWEDLRALNVAISDGNCGALDAVTCADIYMENGRADAILVGGAEALSEALFLAFRRLGIFETGARIGEGSALLAMEDLAHARKRGAQVLAEVVGCGATFDAPDSQGARMIHASKQAMAHAITDALRDAGLEAKDVDAAVSGCAGLRVFDQVEIAGIDLGLGHQVPIWAPKALLGETLGAGGAMSMVVAIGILLGHAPRLLERGEAPKSPKTILVTSMGYYGNATAVLMRASPV